MFAGCLCHWCEEMRMRSIVFSALLSPMVCLANDAAVEARVVYGGMPANISEHFGALKRFSAGDQDPHVIPMPPTDLSGIECGSGTTIAWEKKKKGKPLVTDSSSRSIVIVYFKAQLRPGDRKKVDLGGLEDFLYIGIEHAGGVCAGYADTGSIDLNVALDGSVAVDVDSSIEWKKLRGGRSCSSQRLKLSFVAVNEPDRAQKCTQQQSW